MDSTDKESNLFRYISQASRASTILLSLYEFQQLGQFCDVVLETGSNQHIHAHRVVLAASSPYFRTMFGSDFLERTQRKILIKDWDHDILQAVVTFLYNADFSLPADKVVRLMAAAGFFQLKLLLQECSSFLQQHLSPINCLGTRRFAWQHNFSSLFDTCTKFTCDHFEEVMDSDEFFELSHDQLKDIISRDEVSVSNEAIVGVALVRWVTHEFDSRKNFFPELYSHVRLPLVALSWLSELSGLVKKLCLFRSCQVYIQEAYTYHESPEKRHELRFSPRIRPRKPSGLKGILTVGGGCTGNVINHPNMRKLVRQPLSVVEQYSMDTNSSTLLCKKNFPRSYFAACYYNGNLYVIGGSYGLRKSLNSMLCYSIKESEWYRSTPMLQHRRFHAVQLLYGLFYVTGGKNEQGILSSVERYNPATFQWTELKSMNTQRMQHSLTEMDGLIFAVGGDNGSTRLDTMEFYDPSKDTWTYARSMSRPRAEAGVVTLGGSIYVLGYWEDPNLMERYDVELDKWIPCSPTNGCEIGMGARLVAYDGCLYVCGGSFDRRGLGIVAEGDGFCRSRRETRSVMKYTPSTQKWEACADMLAEKSHFGITSA